MHCRRDAIKHSAGLEPNATTAGLAVRAAHPLPNPGRAVLVSNLLLEEESMRQAVLGAAFTLCVSMAVLGVGCSSPPPPANSFTEVYTKIIKPTCSSDFCHFTGVGIRYSALDMSSQVTAYWSLVDQPCAGASCSQMGTRVVPGRPENSLMYGKVSETMPSCGSQMPANPATLVATGSAVFSGTALTSAQQQLIYNWILEGAQNN
jgi:hypothetical protein